MNFTDAADTPSGREEVTRLKRYIKALKDAHQNEINGLLAQARQQARQIAELRMEAGHATAAAATATRREPTAKVAGQGAHQVVQQGPLRSAGFGLKVEDIVPLSTTLQIAPISTKALTIVPQCPHRRAG